MQQTNRVRTYLDPDAVGPLPRSALADDSDALSVASTVLRVPGTITVEISADDFIEIVDPNRHARSRASIGYDTAFLLPRRRLGAYVVVALGIAGMVLVLAALRSLPTAPRNSKAPATDGLTSPRPAEPPDTSPTSAVTPAPASTVGTLRLESVDAQRVTVDGVALSASAALLRCGPHEVAMGFPPRTRTIDVPCGGEVTVFR